MICRIILKIIKLFGIVCWNMKTKKFFQGYVLLFESFDLLYCSSVRSRFFFCSFCCHFDYSVRFISSLKKNISQVFVNQFFLSSIKDKRETSMLAEFANYIELLNKNDSEYLSNAYPFQDFLNNQHLLCLEEIVSYSFLFHSFIQIMGHFIFSL